MNAQDFVNELFKVRPKEDLFIEFCLKRGLTKTFVEQETSNWILEKRGNYITFEDPIMELIANFKCETVSLGSVNFCDKVRRASSYMFFADVNIFESEWLGISNITGKVELYDPEPKMGSVMASCPSSSGAFLDVLIIYADLRARIYEGQKFSDEEMKNYRDKGLFLAGGEEYAKFIDFLFYRVW